MLEAAFRYYLIMLLRLSSGSAGVSYLIPCTNSVKNFFSVFLFPSLYDTFYTAQQKRKQNSLLQRDTGTHRHRDRQYSIQRGADSGSYNRIQMRQQKTKGDSSKELKSGLLQVKLLQREVLSFIFLNLKPAHY